jgi:predicted RNase H-like HicB family nuclease
MNKYVVIYEQEEDGAWGAYLPDLPGVVALGTTRAEVENRIGEAIAAYKEDLEERHRAMPEPRHAAGTIAA